MYSVFPQTILALFREATHFETHDRRSPMRGSFRTVGSERELGLTGWGEAGKVLVPGCRAPLKKIMKVRAWRHGCQRWVRRIDEQPAECRMVSACLLQMNTFLLSNWLIDTPSESEDVNENENA